MEQMPVWCHSRIINLSPDEQDCGSSVGAVYKVIAHKHSCQGQLPMGTNVAPGAALEV